MAEAGAVCGCGEPLREWTYDSGRRTERLWCVDLTDLLAYRKGQPTRHDIVSPHGERLQRGSCRNQGESGSDHANDG